MLEPLRDLLKDKTIIFASGSESRKSIVRDMGLNGIINFEKSNFNEDTVDMSLSTEEYVLESALQKVLEVETRLTREKNPPDVVIGADTMVTVQNEEGHWVKLGKPKTELEAKSMLKRLSNRENVVFTGMVIKPREGREPLKFVERTTVYFGPITSEQINAYVKIGNPTNYAGGYAIQNAAGTFITGIKGDYYSILGLPINRMCNELYNMFT